MNNNFFIFIIIFLKFIYCFHLANANEIPIIVISAGKTPQLINKVGSSVELITEGEIRNSNNFTLADIIEENSTGINLFHSGSIGGSAGIQLRGLEKRYSSVFIDGVKMMDPSSPDGSFYLENVLANGIESVEILKGTQSSLYGSNAIGGVINIYTKKKSNSKPSFQVETGSNNTKNLLYSFGEQKDKFNYFVSLNKFQTSGISAMNDNDENDAYKNKNIIGNLGFKLSKNSSINNSFRVANTFYNYDEVLNTRTDFNNTTDNLEFSNSLKLEYSKKNFKNSISYNKFVSERYTTNYDLTKNNYFGYRDNLNFLGEYNYNLDNKIIYGIEAEIESSRYKVDYGESDKTHDENIFTYYFDHQIRPLENLYVNYGLREDKHTTAGRKKSGHISGSLNLNNKSKITSSLGAGVRFPSLYDYAYGYTKITDVGGKLEEIKSERGLSFDLGYHTFLNPNLNFDITYFKTELKNPILNNARTGWVQRNSTGKNTTEGIEFSTKWQTTKNLNINFGYTFTKSYDANTCDYEELISYADNECRITNNVMSNAKVRVPRHSIVSKLNYDFNENFTSSLLAKYVGERRDFGNINNNFSDVVLKEYHALDFNSSYKGLNNVILNFNIKNLLNEKFEEAYQYSSNERTLNLSLKSLY